MKPYKALPLLALASALLTPTVQADNLAEREQLTGDWQGVRTALEDNGISVSAENIFECSGVLDGGVTRAGSSRNLFVGDVEFDTEALFGLASGTAFLQFLNVTAEEGGSTDAGDIQGYSNIENDRSLSVLYECWYQQVLFEERFRAKIGKVDANTEFACVAPLQAFSAAGEFTRSSAGFHPTILGFPTYPDPAMSVNLFISPYQGENSGVTLAYGLYDGATGVDGVATGSRGPETFFDDNLSDDYFHIAEVQAAWSGGSLGVGGWHHTGDWDTFDGRTESGTAGFYATLQQQITASDAENPDRGLFLFGQFGMGDSDVAEVSEVYGFGVLQHGIGRTRPDDLLGAYASLAALSDEPSAGFDEDELAIETLYRLQLTPAVHLQPGLQYIVNPSGNASIDNALIGQLRIGIVL